MSKCICKECDWKGGEGETLVATNPFNSAELIYGCPECKSVDCFILACDEPDCWRPVTCGTRTLGGYRQTCGRHALLLEIPE